MSPPHPLNYRLWPALGAMLVAWAVGIGYHFIHQIYFSGWGYATDVSAVLFWSGLFVLVSVVTFVPLATWLFRLLKLPSWAYPFVTAATAIVAIYILLLPFSGPGLGLFSLNFGAVAIIIGLLFGVLYLKFAGAGFRPARPAGILASLSIALLVLRASLVTWAPIWSYQHLDAGARRELTQKAMSGIELGDPVWKLNELLPGFISPAEILSGRISGQQAGLEYDIKSVDGKVISASVSRIN